MVTHIKRGAAQITTKSSNPVDENASCVLGNPKHHLDRVVIFEAFDKSCQIILQKVCINLHSHQQCIKGFLCVFF